MNKLTAAAATSVVILCTGPVFADNVTSKVTAYDRVANRLVLSDKSVFSFDPATVEMPATLTAGDEVLIEFESSEEGGIEQINSISILNEEDDS